MIGIKTADWGLELSRGDAVTMKRTFQPKSVKELRNTVSERECLLSQAERFWLAEDRRAERSYLHNI